MFVCPDCHAKGGCPVEHGLVSIGPCECCRREAACCDCVAGHPVTKAEMKRYEQKVALWRARLKAVYLYRATVEYPSRKE